MKKFLSILIVSLLWCNIGYSNDKINLVCSFQKSVEDIPLATTGSGEIVRTKEDLSPSVTQDEYIEYEVISEDEEMNIKAIIVTTKIGIMMPRILLSMKIRK